jgi:hypothetical protein
MAEAQRNSLAMAEDVRKQSDVMAEALQDVSVATADVHLEIQASDSEDEAQHEDRPEGVLMQGMLTKRAVKSGDNWKDRFFELHADKLMYFAEKGGEGFRREPDALASGSRKEFKGQFEICADCHVHHTGRQNTFKLVTPGKILDVAAMSTELMDTWMVEIRAAVAACPSHEDMNAVIARAQVIEDDFYEVTYAPGQKLGLVTQKRGNWATVVTIADDGPAEMGFDDVITSVNGQDVMSNTYEDTIQLIRDGRKTGLVLYMRRATHKSGMLNKLARGGMFKGKVKTWATRYVWLHSGVVEYYDGQEEDSNLKGDVPLMGSTLKLLSEEEVSRPNCLQLTSSAGKGALTLEAASPEERLDWAASLYHAISIANGVDPKAARAEKVVRARASLSEGRLTTKLTKPKLKYDGREQSMAEMF